MDKEVIKEMQRKLGVDDDGIIGPITRNAIANRVLGIAKREVGVSEVGNTNSGKRVREYQLTTELGGTNWPWCAAFVCWCYKQSNLLSEHDRPKSASAYGFEDWGDRVGLKVMYYPNSVKRGDIVVYQFSHIGIVAVSSDNDGDFVAYEGNTNEKGQREGGQVLEKNRNIVSVRSVIRF